jgi:hypothetical protein
MIDIYKLRVGMRVRFVKSDAVLNLFCLEVDKSHKVTSIDFISGAFYVGIKGSGKHWNPIWFKSIEDQSVTPKNKINLI